MTQDEIIRMAQQADIEVAHMNKPMTNAEVKQAFLEFFAKRVLWSDSLFQSLIDGERAAEREACAKLCDEIEDDHWNLYKGRPPYKGNEPGRADPHEQGVSMGAGKCATAIRARSKR